MSDSNVPAAPSSIGRRTVLGLIGGGAVAGVATACGMGGHGSSSGSGSNGALIDASPSGALVQPTELRSAGGRLAVDLRASTTSVPWQDGERWVMAYNGSVPGPTWRVRPGDVIDVSFHNDLDQPTNLHTHGLHVSPKGASDDPMVMIEPGATQQYRFELPSDHVSGTFWYHPHNHGNSAPQVFAGLAGAIIVEDAIDDLASMRAANERVLVLSDPRIGTTSKVLDANASVRQQGREGDVLLVNGQYQPSISAPVGSIEHWRIVNSSPSRYYVLAVEGAQMQWIGSDQGRFRTPRSASTILLTPGQRAEVLVPLTSAGTVTLQMTEYDRNKNMSMGPGGMGSMMGGGSKFVVSPTPSGTPTPLLTVDVTPASAGAASTLPAELLTFDPRIGEMVSRSRNIAFGAMTMGDGEFVIDGKSFEPGRVDTTAALGTTEEWIITNGSMMDHPFHIHTWPFRVVARSNGGELDPGWRDTVNIPMGQSITIRIPFTDFEGMTVYHCHILDHEDLGMMATIEVA